MDVIPEALGTRTIIMGNSGAGRSWLAGRLAALVRAPAIDRGGAPLGGIIEGVYGWLVEVALPRATALVWLDLPRSDCRSALAELREGVLVPADPRPPSRGTPASRRFSGAKVRLHDRDGVLAFSAEVSDAERSGSTGRCYHGLARALRAP